MSASDEVEAQWQKKGVFAGLPSVEAAVQALSSDALAVVEKAIVDLNLHVDKSYHDERNPLAEFFGAEANVY